jgi:hypothetical protein
MGDRMTTCRWCDREQKEHVHGVACSDSPSSTTWEPELGRRRFFKLFAAAAIATRLPKVELAPAPRTYSFKDVVGHPPSTGAVFLTAELERLDSALTVPLGMYYSVGAAGVMACRIKGKVPEGWVKTLDTVG